MQSLKNFKAKRQTNLSAWRKVSLGTWTNPSHSSIYSTLEIDARPMLKKIDEYKKQGIIISPTSFVGKAIALAIKHYPLINSVIRFGNVYCRADIDVFFQVTTGKYLEDVSGLTIRNCDKVPLSTIAEKLRDLSLKIKNHQDKDFKRRKIISFLLPSFLTSFTLKLISFILYDLNLYIPVFSERDHFGGVMVTSLSMFGVKNAFVPLIPFTRCGLILAVGKVYEKAVVENGEIKIIPVFEICGTLDHRLIDGAGAAKLMKGIQNYLADPE